MDRLNFVNSINVESPEDFISFFNQIMILYDMVSPYRILGVSPNIGDNFSLDVQFDSIADINNLMSYIHNNIAIKYSTQYVCNVKHLDNNSVRITLN